jgi:hypothetical protein
MRLARTLGRTLAELEASMGADEFALWRLLEAEDPLPDPHLSAGLVAYTVARSIGGAKAGRLEDYIPGRSGGARQSPAEVAARARAWLAGLAGRRRNGRGPGGAGAGADGAAGGG